MLCKVVDIRTRMKMMTGDWVSLLHEGLLRKINEQVFEIEFERLMSSCSAQVIKDRDIIGAPRKENPRLAFLENFRRYLLRNR